MAAYFYRLGRFAFRRRRWVLLVWVLLLGICGTAAATLSGPTSNAFSIPGTEAQRAIDMLDERFPQAAGGGATARVMFAAPAGRRLTEPSARAAIGRTVAALRAGPQVAAVQDPYASGAVSASGTIAFAQVTYRVGAADVSEEARDALERAPGPARAAGLRVEMGGDAAEAEGGQHLMEIIGVLVAAVVLVVTFGSLVAAGLPLLTALLGIAIGVTAITAATGFTDLSSSTPTLAIMLGLAVAIDYALFIVSRYRQELAPGGDPEEAAGRAVGTAGTAVMFAGLTVVIGLAGLTVVGIPILTEMGLAAAATVVVAVLIALTLLPALLGFAGRRVLGRRGGTRRTAAQDTGGGSGAAGRGTMGIRWARQVTRRPIPFLLAAGAALAALAVPAADLRLGLPDDSISAPDTSRRQAYDLLAEGFGPGFNGPLTLVVDAARSDDPQAAARHAGSVVSRLPGVAAARPATFNQGGDTALIMVMPRSGPGEQATTDLVERLRGQAPAIRAATGASIAVTGLTALNIDMSAKLADALVPYLAVVVGLAMVLLLLVFRSVLIPLKATAGFLLSVAATFGAVVAVFQWGWAGALFGVDQTGPIISALPIFLIGLVFGLAMDYQVFLVTRMREAYVHGADPEEAVVTGFAHGARVVTAAAIIMAAVFSGFLLAPDPLVKSIGFALAAATLFDAFVVRMTIVPAVMTLTGRAAWWLPRWLDRLLPGIDVEGDSLAAARPAVPPGPREPEAAAQGAGAGGGAR
ncbi:MMPL family transporter [Spirillospora sp. CA-255316]